MGGGFSADTVAGQLHRLRRDDWARFAIGAVQQQRLWHGLLLVHHGLQQLTAAVQQQSTLLASIDDALRNPRAVRAAEHARRGLRCLAHGWDKDAVQELRDAVTLDRYEPGPQLALGIAHARTGEYAAAAEALACAARYGAGSGLGASAALLLLLCDDIDPQLRREVAAAALTNYPSCAEVLLAAAGVLEDLSLTATALWWDPALAFSAVAAQAPGADAAASHVADDPTAAPAVLARMPDTLKACQPIMRVSNLRWFPVHPGLWSTSVPERLAAAAWLLGTDCWSPTTYAFPELAGMLRYAAAGPTPFDALSAEISREHRRPLYYENGPLDFSPEAMRMARVERRWTAYKHRLADRWGAAPLHQMCADLATVHQVRNRLRPAAL